jgi:anti-anti-sigma regulatory factor
VLKITSQESRNGIVLECEGRIVFGEETTLLCAASAHYGRDVILDLSKVEAIDAAGFGALIALQAAGIYLQLANPNAAVLAALHRLKLDTVFAVRTATECVKESPPDVERLAPKRERALESIMPANVGA